jgi:hypothetical protein
MQAGMVHRAVLVRLCASPWLLLIYTLIVQIYTLIVLMIGQRCQIVEMAGLLHHLA